MNQHLMFTCIYNLFGPDMTYQVDWEWKINYFQRLFSPAAVQAANSNKKTPLACTEKWQAVKKKMKKEEDF